MSIRNFKKDIIKSFTKNGDNLEITFIKHASLVFEFKDKLIYIDPVMEFCDYKAMPKADYIFITHHHYDHYDKEAINSIIKSETIIIGNKSSIKDYGSGIALKNSELKILGDYINVKAVEAYNVSEDCLDFHPKGMNNGYIIDFDGSKVYISGDTEFIAEMENLKNTIDIAFLSVNQPYTMSVDQAIKAAKLINPKILYPYHYGQTDIKTSIQDLLKGLETTGIDVRIRSLE